MNYKDTIVQLVFDLNHAVKHYMHKSHEEGNIGITMPQRMVVGMLFRHQELKISELSHRLGLSNSTVSGIVDRLEKQRIVERVRGEKDRRVVRVRLTPQAAEKHKDIQKNMEKNLERLLDKCTPEEIGKVIDGLSILKDVLDR